MGSASPEMKLITAERKRMDFSIEEMTNVLDGGIENTAHRREIVELVQNDAVLGDMDIFYKSGEERYINALKRSLRVRKLDLDFNDPSTQALLFRAVGKEIALPIHSGAFVPTVTNLGTPEQVKKWVTLAKDFQILGTYAQTELGHGTNLRGLETTATYDPKTQEFVMNCPKLSSMKWWPGDLGKSANHACVMADLIIKGQSYGMHPFIVQIRDLSTHMPLPGVQVGDIGEKFAFEVNDNGYLIFNNVRIPRENLLAAVAEVDKDGNYDMKGDPRVIYGGMMMLRVRLVDSQAINPLQMACTIATRYSVVRRQGAIKQGDPENSILDYVTQQHKILPLIAQSYAFHFASKQTHAIYHEIFNQMKSGNFENLPELHALTAGMKAYLTDRCLAGADVCRRACGGHGYLKASGFYHLLLPMMASVTYEGENTVMYLQCARHLIKCVSQSTAGNNVEGMTSYLNEPVIRSCSVNSEKDFAQPSVLLKCIKHRAGFLLRQTNEKLQKLNKSGHSRPEAWNMTSVQLVKMTMAHLDSYVLSTFVEMLKEMKVSTKIRQILTEVCSLFGLHIINENTGDFLKDGYMNGRQVKLAQEAELKALCSIRKYALGLVDAFEFTDKSLQSCIGSYDGNAYERLYENAKRSPRNKTEVHEDFYKVFQPYLHKGRDILQNKQSKL